VNKSLVLAPKLILLLYAAAGIFIKTVKSHWNLLFDEWLSNPVVETEMTALFTFLQQPLILLPAKMGTQLFLLPPSLPVYSGHKLKTVNECLKGPKVKYKKLYFFTKSLLSLGACIIKDLLTR